DALSAGRAPAPVDAAIDGRGGVMTPVSDALHDEQLAGLLDQLTDRQRRGEFVDVESLARQHPEIAGELRRLWAAVQVAGAFGRLSSPSLPPAKPATPAAASALPRRFGDYELLEEIGRGGMGVVYKARQVSLDRLVALKMLRY